MQLLRTLVCVTTFSGLLVACGSGGQSAAPGASGAGQGSNGMGGAARVTAVVASTVQESDFVDETEALGTAKANEAVDITAKATNRVVEVRFREGQNVRKGEVLVEFDGSEARANLASAQASLRDTESQYQRSRELFQSKALSESDLIQLEAKMLSSKAAVDAAQARVNDTVITAPFSGRMGLRNVSVGSLVTPGQVISTLDDTSVIKLDFTVPETYLATLREGQPIDASSSAYPQVKFAGRVATLGTRVDSVSRSLVVRALIDNRQQLLKPGMFMTVRLVRNQGKAMLIPEQALMPESDQQFVYVVKDDKAGKVAVTIGRRKPGLVEVRGGLKPGDQIVVEGGDKLTEGAAVRITEGGQDTTGDRVPGNT